VPRGTVRPGKGHVHALGRQSLSLNHGAELEATFGQRRLDGLSDLVRDGPDARPVFRRQRPDAAQHGRQIALLAEVLDLQLVECRGIRRFGDLGQRQILEAMQIAAQALEVHAHVSSSSRRAERLGVLQVLHQESRTLDRPRPVRTRGRVEGSRYHPASRAAGGPSGRSCGARYRGPIGSPTCQRRLDVERFSERLRSEPARSIPDGLPVAGPSSLVDLESEPEALYSPLLRRRLRLFRTRPSPAGGAQADALPATATICANAGASRTARSARILRSRSMFAALRPAISLP
jgi:hypothetical protein